MIIKRNKIKEDKRKEEKWYLGRMFGEMKGKEKEKSWRKCKCKKKLVQFDEHNFLLFEFK